uniref:Uncharacterized protein n=1 Tax=Daucus carota subsp. sativus TaxID=79200 RepID=A0A164WVA2_DAUCS
MNGFKAATKRALSFCHGCITHVQSQSRIYTDTASAEERKQACIGSFARIPGEVLSPPSASYKPKSVRKRKKFAEKENVKGNSAKRFSFPTSSVTDGRHDTPPPRIPSAVTGTPLTLRQTQYSSAHGGTIPCDFKHSLETAGFLSTPENTLNTKRTPLSNITNIVDDNNVPITRHQNSAVISSTPENTLNTTRTPLSNITNIVDINSKRNRCKYLGMYENNLRDTARNLFAETSSRLDEYSAESSSQTEDTAKCMPDDDNGSSSIDEDYVPGMDTDCDSG